jgi:hypothetical protein
MGIGMSVPKVPKLPGRKKKAGAKPVQKTSARKRVVRKGKKPPTKRTSRYEDDEPEEFANWAMAMSPAAYEAVAARPKLASRRTSPYEDEPEEYEDDMDEEYETDDEEGYMARHQEYTPADFSSVATPINFSVLLMVVLFLLLVLSRR